MSDFSDDGLEMSRSVKVENGKSDKFSDVRRDFTDPSTPHDRILVVGELKTKFYVYAGHLSFCSEFFRTLFNGNFKEKNENEIELKELDAEEFNLFLKALIPCNTSVISAENYLFIFSCASRFLSPEVLANCEKFVFNSFEDLDKIDLLKMAFDYNWEELKDKLAIYLLSTTVAKQDCKNNCSAEQQGSFGKHYYKWCNNCEYFESDQSGQLFKLTFLIENKEKLSALSDEINAFVLKVLLKKDKQ